MTHPSNFLIPTILSGGSGARLWPVSREQNPKPFIRLEDGQSLLQKAFLRGALLPGVREVITVTNKDFFFRIKDEYEEVSPLLEHPIHSTYILEPFGRNTAPAIALACKQAIEIFGEDSILLILAADHIITNQSAFTQAVRKACDLAQEGKIVTFGIQPTDPETGYGYIEYKGHDVIRFVEKPELKKAIEYYESSNFLWNSGMFCFKAKTMVEELNSYTPKIVETVEVSIAQSERVDMESGTQLSINAESFKLVPSESIDYAVMEKTQKAAVVACDIGWSDIGCWKALGDLMVEDSHNNRVQGEVFLKDTKNCTIKSENRLIATVGIQDLIVVDTEDALLIANKNQAQNVKKVFEHLKEKGHEVHKLHRTVTRPWGTYTVLEEGEHFKIKRIEVKPGAMLSLQMHQHRSEHWVVVKGKAKVLNGDKEFVLEVNESTYIPAGHKHRLENVGNDQLVLIEVQTGSYLGEDDITRFQDIYGRAV